MSDSYEFATHRSGAGQDLGGRDRLPRVARAVLGRVEQEASVVVGKPARPTVRAVSRSSRVVVRSCSSARSVARVCRPEPQRAPGFVSNPDGVQPRSSGPPENPGFNLTIDGQRGSQEQTAVKRNGTDSGAIARLADRDRPISAKARTTAATSNGAPALKWSRSDAVDVSRMSIYLT